MAMYIYIAAIYLFFAYFVSGFTGFYLLTKHKKESLNDHIRKQPHTHDHARAKGKFLSFIFLTAPRVNKKKLRLLSQ